MERADMMMSLPVTDPAPLKGKRFKLRHKPSGLFYRPNKGFRGIHERIPNLSPRGKEYRNCITPLKNRTFVDTDGRLKALVPTEWEVVEVDE